MDCEVLKYNNDNNALVTALTCYYYALLFIHPHLIYGLNRWGFKHKLPFYKLPLYKKKTVRILAFRPYISHSISAFKDLKILMLEDLYKIQLYKIYYKNTNNILPSYFQTFTPHYYNALEHGHDLRHNVVRLPLTKREYYVQCTKYQFLKLIKDTSQSDLVGSLTSSLTQFITYFKYSIIESYNPQCTSETVLFVQDNSS